MIVPPTQQQDCYTSVNRSSQFNLEKSAERARAAAHSAYDTRQTDEVSDVFTGTFMCVCVCELQAWKIYLGKIWKAAYAAETANERTVSKT